MQIKEIMTHTTFVIFYIVLNIIYLYILGSAGKDIKKAISGHFQHFLLGNQCSLPLLFPLFPSAPFAVWVSVWVKGKIAHSKTAPQ